ncbi:hypothetical protein SESBI_12792 [Sesbania bispinosa]|nr:hypothetical protein SESBI_12792 [Sesbania bispinosa]
MNPRAKKNEITINQITSRLDSFVVVAFPWIFGGAGGVGEEEEEVGEGLNFDSGEVIEIGKLEENGDNNFNTNNNSNDNGNGVSSGKKKGEEEWDANEKSHG